MGTVQDRRELRRKLLQIAGHQSGLFTAAQARDAGYSYAAQKYHVDHGNWFRIERGIFRLPEWPPERHEDLIRWALWSGGKGVISRDTALSVYALGDVDPIRTHLTVPPGFRKSAPGVVLHRETLPSEDIQAYEGFPITTPIRSILDVAATMDMSLLVGTIRDALETGKVMRRELLFRADAFGAQAALGIERAMKELDGTLQVA
jgi:predicted transcriptional regulator of viral defense system